MCIWYSNTSKSELTTRQLGKSYLAAPNPSVPACTRSWCHIWQCLALTLLCRSRKVVLLGSWFSFIWLQWHLCDRGFLGYVVFHWTLCSHLLGKGKQQVKSEKETAARLRVREQNSRVFQDCLWFPLARQPHWPRQLLWQAGRQQRSPEQVAASSLRLQVPFPSLAPEPTNKQVKFTLDKKFSRE